MDLRRMRPAVLALALALMLAPMPRSAAETCSVESFGEAVDASAAELRTFSAETQPRLKQKLQALRDHKGWTDPDYETRGLRLIHDKKLDDFDAQAGELLSKIDTLGTPESADSAASTSCANLAELKAASSELMAVMRAKSAYLIARIDREIGAAPDNVATAAPDKAAPAAAPPAAKAPETPMAGGQPDLSPIRRTETARKDTAPPAAKPDTAAPPAGGPAPAEEPEVTSSWSTTTAQAVVPPPPVNRAQPDFDRPPPGEPYALPPDGAFEEGYDDEAGYTIDEIREATRGFFGTISTSLASVIEHAFRKAGRPTAYVLGQEGGGAFLAGLRYGEGTLYLRSGGTQKVYWHGPSLGYDVGAEGSRTLFLIYSLEEPNGLFRRFTGVDGSAYLVGGVGMTLLKGGPVLMAPIRSGLGLRIGANIGYVRFTPRPTWNPF